MIEYELKNAKTLPEAIENLYTILTLLRSPDGCPWDREQTTQDVLRALIDETYEYIDALDKQDIQGCSEEIGDMLLNTLMISRIHEEQHDFTPVQSVNAVCEKLVRRHPHVFSTAHADTSSDVLDLWNSIKEDVEGKKAHDEDFFSRVPKTLPKLEESWEIQKNMRKVGFDWPDIHGVLDKVAEELQELGDAIKHTSQDRAHVEEELGDLLFSIVNVARYLKISPSIALHRCNRKVRSRFNNVVKKSAERGIPLAEDHADALNEIWQEIKSEER